MSTTVVFCVNNYDNELMKILNLIPRSNDFRPPIHFRPPSNKYVFK